MGNRKCDEQEEWIKPGQFDLPKGEFVVTNFQQDLEGLKVKLENEECVVGVFFNGIPVLFQEAVEGMRMRTWGEVQQKYYVN